MKKTSFTSVNNFLRIYRGRGSGGGGGHFWQIYRLLIPSPPLLILFRGGYNLRRDVILGTSVCVYPNPTLQDLTPIKLYSVYYFKEKVIFKSIDPGSTPRNTSVASFSLPDSIFHFPPLRTVPCKLPYVRSKGTLHGEGAGHQAIAVLNWKHTLWNWICILA